MSECVRPCTVTPVTDSPTLTINRHTVNVLLQLTGTTVSALAAATGEDRANLTHALAGRRRLKPQHLKAIAQTLGVPIAALLGPAEDPLADVA